GTSGDTERRAPRRRRRLAAQDLAVLDRIDQAQSEHLQRNAERQVALGEFAGEIRLSDVAVGDSRIFGDGGDDPQLVHAAVARAVGLELEADLADRTELQLEGRDHVALAEAIGNEAEHRVFRRQRRTLARIGDEEAARAAQSRLKVAPETL